MKPRLLILPASIRSHVLPSLYVADRLSEEGYEVYYAVTNDVLAELVTKNGYQAVKNTGWRVGYGMEASYLAAKKEKVSYWRLLKAYRTNELYWERKRELDALIEELRPTTILVDLFAYTDYWVLYPRRSEFNIAFFNPMPSTYRVGEWPIVSSPVNPPMGDLILSGSSHTSQSNAQQGELKLGWRKRRDLFLQFLRNPRQTWLRQAVTRHRQFLEQISPLAQDATVTQVIANVPEFVLAPLEFEFAPEIRKPNQHYLGLCMREHRQDTELDPAFEKVWELIKAQKKNGERLVYCSFGTFYEGADAMLLRFVTNLLEVIADLPQVHLVCSVNKYVIETLRARKLLTNCTHFFSRVPQLTVLAEADVFITHAGFGSIKEAIYYGVPMLAYPLDPHYDQNGNAVKIEYHGLGLRGAFAHERLGDLKKKLERLLEEKTFREKVRQFREVIDDGYKEEKIKETVQSLLVDKHSVVLA
ncbi:glycosyltransferase [Runella zeae]|uniref:glycosyltransferase n=1 Tax=Runella zeae TaxID=94255 RepID=UPI00041EDB09|nr:glycosyltransferase [Runella zeae]